MNPPPLERKRKTLVRTLPSLRALIAGRCFVLCECQSRIALEYTIHPTTVGNIVKEHLLDATKKAAAVEAAEEYRSSTRPKRRYHEAASESALLPTGPSARREPGLLEALDESPRMATVQFAMIPSMGSTFPPAQSAANASDRPASDLPESRFPSFSCSTPGGFPTFHPPSQGGESMRYVYSPLQQDTNMRLWCCARARTSHARAQIFRSTNALC